MRVLPAFLLSLAAAPALAASVTVTVRGPDGKPLAGAVVEVTSPRAPAAATGFSGPFVVAQQNISFQPHVLIVPVGAQVSFPNRDKVRHHVYSFSSAKKFELKLYGRDETRSVTFDKPGVVALGCNIHDAMSGFVIVVDTPFAAQSGADGTARLDGVPPGPVTVTVWHPSVRAANNMLSQLRTVPAAGLDTTLAVASR